MIMDHLRRLMTDGLVETTGEALLSFIDLVDLKDNLILPLPQVHLVQRWGVVCQTKGWTVALQG